VALLAEADAIDPQSATAVFRRLGYRREAGRWVEAGAERAADAAAADTDRLPGAGDDPLLGLTPDEVLARQGKPSHRSILMTQGGLLIQWIYETGQGGRSVVTFVQRPGSPPTVVSRFGLH